MEKLPNSVNSKSKILLVGIDGLLLDRAIDSGKAKTLDSLRNQGFFTRNKVDLPTYSGPSWSTYLTGKSIETHNVLSNNFTDHRLDQVPDFLSIAADLEPGVKTYAAAGWLPLVQPDGIGPVIRHRPHKIESNEHILFTRDGDTHGYLKIDYEVHEHAKETLKNFAPDFSFVYFCSVDEAGHEYGAIEAPYFDAVERVDNYLDSLHKVITERAKNEGEPWLLVVITDHGHRDEGGHGGDSEQERASFVISVGIGRKNPNWPNEIHPKELVGLILNER